MDNDKIPVINIITIGDASVGKTCMILRYSEDKFYDDLAATIGLEVKSKMIDILDGSQTIMLKIWDTAGQERFQSISRSYYQKADGIFVVFDLSKKDTFLKTQKFIDSIFDSANENVAVVFIGNKCDKDRCITEEEAQNFAKLNAIKYFETSAKLDININEAFNYLAEKAFNHKPIHEKVPKQMNIEKKEETGNCKC